MLTQVSHIQWDLKTAEQVKWRLDLAYPFPHRFD